MDLASLGKLSVGHHFGVDLVIEVLTALRDVVDHYDCHN
jgi:hypothetical protein